MPTAFKWLLFLLLFNLPAVAQPTILPVPVRTYTVSEGGSVTLPFVTSWMGAGADSLEDRVSLPSGWKVLRGQGQFLPVSGGQAVRLVTLMIPRTAAPGNYTVYYRVALKARKTVADSAAVFIVIPARRAFDLAAQQAQTMVGAGRQVFSTYRLSNRGNAPLRVRLRTSVQAGWEARLDSARIVLPAGQIRFLRVGVSPPGRLEREEVAQVQIEALADEMPDSLVKASMEVRAYPRSVQVARAYHRLPLQIRIGAGSVDRFSGGSIGYLVGAISSQGALEEGSTTRLNLDAVAPSISEFNMEDRDRYTIGLSGARYNLGLGDVSTRVSPLMGNSVYGFGTYGNVRIGPVETGGFWMRDRRNPAFGQAHTGGQLMIYPIEAIGVGGGYVERDAYYRSGTARTARIAIRPMKAFSVEAEKGWGADEAGQRADGHSLTTTFQVRGFSTGLDYQKVDTNYPVPLYGNERIAARASLSPGRAINVSGWYWIDRIDPDSASGISGWSNHSYEVSARHGTGLTLYMRGNEAFFDGGTARRLSGRAEIQRALKGHQVTFGLEHGRTGLAGEGRGFTLVNLASAYSSRAGTGYSGYLSMEQGEEEFVGGPPRRLFSGALSLNWPVLKRTVLSAGGFGSIATGRTRYTSAGGRLRIQQDLPWNHQVRLSGDLRSYSQGRRLGQVYVQYVVPLSIPIHRERSTGHLRGKIVDAGTGRPYVDMPVNLEGSVVLTDDGGEFVFPRVRPGMRRLLLDQVARAGNLYVADSSQLAVEVVGGRDSHVQIPLMKLGSVAGRLSVVDTTSGAEQSLAGLMVELRGGQRPVRVFSDQDGLFTIGRLRPGEYTITMYGGQFGTRYAIQQDSARFVLQSGEAKQVDFRVRPQARRIRFMASSRTAAPAAGSPSPSPSARDSAPSVRDSAPSARDSAPSARDSAPVERRVPKYLEHETVAGDTFARLARRYYGDLSRWPEIWQANRDRVPEADALKPGIVLRIPQR